jgi:threonylcarbamoyladenosine tRNA methylthiotransferase CDKAL1
MNIYIETFGCSANQSNSEIMKGILTRNGFIVVENEALADIIILNTCIVKEPTIKGIEARIKHFAAKKLIVAGCMPEVLAERIRELAPGASMLGTHHVKDVIKAIKDARAGKKSALIGRQNEIKLCTHRIPKNKVIGITQISQGCVNQCAYCIVKNVKGPLFSYPPELVLKDVKNAVDAGAKEIWITSQDNAAYGLDNGMHELPGLLNKVCNVKGRFFVRLGMMNPSSLLPICNELIERYKNKKMFKFLHLPIQSGSDRVLNLMNRQYNSNDFIDLVRKFRKEFPDITLATDIIVGFPGETEKDFQETLSLVNKIRPTVINISKFWPMQGTEASKMKQVDVQEVKKRASELTDLHRKITLEINQECVGKKFKVLVDEKGSQDTFISRNINYRQIVLKGKHLLGKMVEVEIEKAANYHLIGKIITL